MFFFTVLVTVSKDGVQASACIELLPALLLQFEGSIFFFFSFEISGGSDTLSQGAARGIGH